MNRTEWQKIEELFNAVFELPAENRAAFLDSVCEDAELRSEVESLLKNAEKEDSFLGQSNLPLGFAILNEEKKHLLIGKKIGRYQITRLLGEGGMGEVYLAEDLPLNRQVALKLLPAYLVEDDESVARFQKEALAASAISHPNIAHIYEAGIEVNRRFIAMEYVEGTTLRELVKQKKLDVITSLDIIWQTVTALASSHQVGIIHRDIKPENIMIRRDGYVKVLDFGIAKLSALTSSEQGRKSKSRRENPQLKSRDLQVTKPGLVMGTMGYISPEQLKNKDVDLRTDIWSVGVVLYEILSGNKPFKGKTTEEIRKAILRSTPPSIPFSMLNTNDEATLQKILAKMLNKKAGNRYQSANELANDLKQLKQSLEFTQRFSTGEIIGEKSSSNISGTFGQTGNSSFITKSKLFWTQQSLSRKMFMSFAFVGFLTFVVGISVQYISRFYANKTSKLESFSPDSRNRWQSSILFGMRLKAGGFIGSYSFSPDGKAIAFHLASGGKDSIYIRRFNEADAKKITNDVGKFQTPVWSPDGKHIAFVTIRDNKNGIWTIPADGGEAKLKTPLSISTSYCELLKWSNDGKKMFFKSALALKTIDVETGQIENIDLPREKLAGVYSISPDESVIAFLTIDGDTQQIWAYNLKTRELNDVTDETNEQLRPAIVPDNKRLIYSSNKNGSYQLYSTDFVSKKATQLTFSDSNASDPLVSPDGKNIVYLSENRYANIFAADVKTKKEERITEATKMQIFPDLSSDGTSLVYQVTDEVLTLRQSLLRIKNLQTSEESVLENQIGYWAKWSPRMNEIAFLRNEGLTENLWKFRISDGQATKLTSDGIWVQGYSYSPFSLPSSPFYWSPDGTKIALVSNQSKIPNVCTIDNDGANLRHLTKNENNKKKYNSPMWSANDGGIAVSYQINTDLNKYEYGISLIVDNQEKEVFKSEFITRLLGWTADDQNLLVSVNDGKAVKLLEVSEQKTPKLLSTFIDADFNSLSLSPDKKAIAYSAGKTGIANIFLYSNNKKEQLTDNGDDSILFSGISWSPKGDKIFYSKQSGALQISMISDTTEKTE